MNFKTKYANCRHNFGRILAQFMDKFTIYGRHNFGTIYGLRHLQHLTKHNAQRAFQIISQESCLEAFSTLVLA